MIHEIFPVGPLQCNCSIIGDEQTSEAMVIDPGDDIDQVLAIVQRHGLTVKQIVITHAHIDHIGGAAKLKRITGAPVLLNSNDQMLLKMLDVQASCKPAVLWLMFCTPRDTPKAASASISQLSKSSLRATHCLPAPSAAPTCRVARSRRLWSR